MKLINVIPILRNITQTHYTRKKRRHIYLTCLFSFIAAQFPHLSNPLYNSLLCICLGTHISIISSDIRATQWNHTLSSVFILLGGDKYIIMGTWVWGSKSYSSEPCSEAESRTPMQSCSGGFGQHQMANTDGRMG